MQQTQMPQNDTHHNTLLVPHGARPNVFWRPNDVVDIIMMNLELWWCSGSLSMQVDIVGQAISQYSMTIVTREKLSLDKGKP
jgi:hypothetical protein